MWAEPSVVGAARFEFEQTEEFLQGAEAVTGCDYVWTRYDILCLPPSFPYGGVRTCIHMRVQYRASNRQNTLT